MKHLKLYESFLEDYKNLDIRIDSLKAELNDLEWKRLNIEKEYTNKILTAFEQLKQKTDDQNVNEYEVKLGYISNKLNIVRLYKDFSRNINAEFALARGSGKPWSLSVEGLNVDQAAVVLDAIAERYPEYFQADKYGFMDVKGDK